MTNHINAHLPIAVFDSGIGGLTVLQALKSKLPNENFLYLGDTARLPYGTKSKDTVISYALNASQVLIDRQVKIIVVACNTASSVALEALERKYYPVPVIGVIEAGADKAISLPDNPAIAVMATESTVRWGAYSKHILQKDMAREVVEWPCSLLVALTEEGWHDGPLVEEILRKLLAPLWEQFDSSVSKALVLGCTHFPVLKQAITKVIDDSVFLVDSTNAVAERVAQILEQYKLYNPQERPGDQQFLVTDGIDRFQRVAKHFLPAHSFDVKAEWVTLDHIDERV